MSTKFPCERGLPKSSQRDQDAISGPGYTGSTFIFYGDEKCRVYPGPNGTHMPRSVEYLGRHRPRT